MSHHRRIAECQHKDTITTINAGLERIVCEKCGYVSVRYIESTVRLKPEQPQRQDPQPGIGGCGWCSEPVEFLIPSGMACELHAWKEASKQQVLGAEPWIPIAIDQRSRAR